MRDCVAPGKSEIASRFLLQNRSASGRIYPCAFAGLPFALLKIALPAHRLVQVVEAILGFRNSDRNVDAD